MQKNEIPSSNNELPELGATESVIAPHFGAAFRTHRKVAMNRAITGNRISIKELIESDNLQRNDTVDVRRAS